MNWKQNLVRWSSVLLLLAAAGMLMCGSLLTIAEEHREEAIEKVNWVSGTIDAVTSSVGKWTSLVGIDLNDYGIPIDAVNEYSTQTAAHMNDGSITVREGRDALTESRAVLADVTAWADQWGFGTQLRSSLESNYGVSESGLKTVQWIYNIALAVVLLLTLLFALLHILGRGLAGYTAAACYAAWLGIAYIAAERLNESIDMAGVFQISVWPVLAVVCALVSCILWTVYRGMRVQKG